MSAHSDPAFEQPAMNPAGGAAPPLQQNKGCLRVFLWVLLGCAVLFLLVIVGLYFSVMHSSMPFKMLEAQLQAVGTNADFKVQGISGTLATGIQIQSIRWGEASGSPGEIRDIRIRYNGAWDLFHNHKLVLKEVHVGKAHLDISELDGLTQILHFRMPTPPPGAFPFNPDNQPQTRATSSFQIDQVSFQDVLLTNHDSGFSLAIPSVKWTGFKSVAGKIELGQLSLDSDRLKIATTAGRTVSIGGQPVTFQKLITGNLQPRLHPALRRAVDFTVDIDPGKSNLTWLVSAFDGKIESYTATDGSGFFKCKDLDLGDYLDGPVPQSIAVEAARKSGSDERLKVSRGSFKLGIVWFDLQPPKEDQAAEPSEESVYTAVSRPGSDALTWQLTATDLWNLQQRLTADPLATPRDTVAKTFYGKSYADLPHTAQQDVDKKRPVFFDTDTNAPVQLEK
jgi:hypothetical protein